MIIVKISGGLGNQLFQYAFGQYMSLKLNTVVKYHFQTNIKSNNYTPRNILLQDFKIRYVIATELEIYMFIPKIIKFFIPYKFLRRILQVAPFLSNKLYIEKNAYKPFNSKYIRDNCYYDGYWQSLNFISRIPQFKINCALIRFQGNKKILDISNSIQNCNSVSIHVRRGDYLSVNKNKNIFFPCDMDYYLKAVNYFKKKLTSPQFFIFSDDLDWVINNFKGPNFTVVSGNSPTEDMYLMSICQHNIIANSTFSWWGAWLNNNQSKIVITPKRWFKKRRYNQISLQLPDNWIGF